MYRKVFSGFKSAINLQSNQAQSPSKQSITKATNSPEEECCCDVNEFELGVYAKYGKAASLPPTFSPLVPLLTISRAPSIDEDNGNDAPEIIENLQFDTPYCSPVNFKGRSKSLLLPKAPKRRSLR